MESASSHPNGSIDTGREEEDLKPNTKTSGSVIKERWFKTLVFISINSWLIGLWSVRLVNPNWWIFTTKSQVTDVYPKHLPEFYVHMLFGISTLLIGPFQFLKSFRQKGWHAILGRIYMVALMCSGVAGFIFAWVGFGGLVGHLGFATLSVLWLGSGLMGYHAIKARRVQEHRRWMIRNFAMTFSAVTIRLYLIVPITYNGITTKGKFVDTYSWQYAICVWLAFIPNLIVAELFLWYERRSQVAKS